MNYRKVIKPLAGATVLTAFIPFLAAYLNAFPLQGKIGIPGSLPLIVTWIFLFTYIYIGQQSSEGGRE